jgi:hypothetical protein
VPVPWLIVKSPARVVERLVIVPVVLLSVAIVPDVKMPAVPVVVPAVNVGISAVVIVPFVIVPFVIAAAVDVVVPAMRVEIVPLVMFAPVLIVRPPVAVPYVKFPESCAFTYVPPVSASSNRL